MSDLTIKGAVKLINEVKVISDRFSVREFVITTLDPKYPQDILFQAVNDKMDAVAPLRKSQVVDGFKFFVVVSIDEPSVRIAAAPSLTSPVSSGVVQL